MEKIVSNKPCKKCGSVGTLFDTNRYPHRICYKCVKCGWKSARKTKVNLEWVLPLSIPQPCAMKFSDGRRCPHLAKFGPFCEDCDEMIGEAVEARRAQVEGENE